MNLNKWSRPQDYSGKEWHGYYVAPVTINRDSGVLDRSNWDTQLKEIPESVSVIVVREGHFLVGWVEWLAIHESDKDALRIAEDIAKALDDYPCLDEMDLCNREFELYQESWELWGESEYREKLLGMIDLDFPEDEIEAAVQCFNTIPLLVEARDKLGWEYEVVNGDEIRINIDGMAENTSTGLLNELVEQAILSARTTLDIRKLCEVLGVSDDTTKQAVASKLTLVSQIMATENNKER